jgi:hypothetical protein
MAQATTIGPFGLERRYVRREGFRVSNADAEAIGKTADSIEAQTGTCTSQQFLDAATDPLCEAHRLFEWDDATAADKHRLNQAAYFLRSYKIQVRQADGEWVEAQRARVVPDRKDPDAWFRDVEKVKAAPLLSDQYEEQLMEDLLAFVRRWDWYLSFTKKTPLMQRIQKVVKVVRTFLKKEGRLP